MEHVTVSFNISRQRLLDTLTTAWEQGISYWVNDGDFKEASVERNAKGFVTAINFEKHGSRVPAFMPSVTIAGTRDRVARVDVIELAKAYGAALSSAQDGYDKPLDNPEDNSWAATRELEGNFDATTADALVQIALFGKVIYG